MKKMLQKTTSFLLAALLVTGASIMPLGATGLNAGEMLNNPTFESDGIGIYDKVYFGSASDSPIDWRVLETDAQNNKVLLFQEGSSTNLYFRALSNWQKSTLRTYLNSTFLSKLATSNSNGQEVVLNAIVTADDDKVTLLSKDDVEKYFSSDQDRIANTVTGTPAHYWTKSSYINPDLAYNYCVTVNGVISNYRSCYDLGIRPALQLNVSGLFKSGEGTKDAPYTVTGSADVASVSAGSYVEFGNIAWKVLDVQGDIAYVVSDNVLENKSILDINEANKWNKSDVRELLNPVDGVYKSVYSFGKSELDTVVETGLDDVSTTDKFFLLTESDMTNPNYFGNQFKQNIALGEAYWLRKATTMKEYVYSICEQGNFIAGLESNNYAVRPAFWMDWQDVIFASAIKDNAGENPLITQSGNGYKEATGTANNYKLTIKNDQIGSLSGLPAEVATSVDVATISGANVAVESDGTYSIVYKIEDMNGNIVGYNVATDVVGSGNVNFDIKTTGLYKDNTNATYDLAQGEYTAYVWLQKNNVINSNEATTPVAVKLTVVAITPAPTVISIDNVNVTTNVNKAPVLPNTVHVHYSDNTEGTLPVVWDAIDSSAYAQVGTFTVNGTVEGTEIKAVATVTVKEAEKTIIKINASALVTVKKGSTVQIIATATPVQNLTWTSSNPTIASITSDGLVKANTVGIVILTVTAADGTTSVMTLRVTP